MPDTRKPLDLSSANEILNSKRPPLDLSGAQDILKKKVDVPLNSTATPPKLDSEITTGSSGGVNPAFKSSIPSPIPDFNSMESVKSVVEKPAKINLKMPPVEEDESFMDYLKEGLDSGIAIASKSIYDTPALIYDNVAGLITNPIFRAMGVEEDKLASSKKLADNLGFKNIPSAILKEKIKVSNEKLNKYALKNGVDPLTAIENGEYKNAAKLVAGTTVQSLPMMVVALLSGGSKTALTAIGVSTASTKNSELEESNPEMGLGTRVVNANNAGIIEATTGHLFTGASGAVMKRIIADKGVEAGSKIIGKSFMATAEKAIEKNPFVSAFGEIVEESAVEFGNQANDIASGIRTEFDIHAIKNAGLSATGMGGLQTLGVYGAKGYVKAKDYAKLKSVNKEVFKLRSEIDNGNLSPENKAILSLRADRLEAENKKSLGTEIEKAKALPTEQKVELNALNSEFENLKTKFDDIDDADDIPENLKPAMKEEIKLQASKNQKRKTEILSQNDGLEVKDDFSKFEGVEPDFNLENGKISSLPLKEQDRLNKLAVEQITGGDKTIEYTKEQVSQTANEIYKNEQTPATPEAQPQAEVPQQAEAEKVAEVSPVEDVVATSVEKPLSLQEENVSMDNNLRKEKQLEIINKSNPAPNSHNTWVRTVDDIKEAKDVFETAFNDGEMYPDFTVDDMKESLDSGEITIHSSRPIKNGSFVTPSRMNAEEYAGGKGSKIYSKTIKINDVAWIDESEGQYAPIKETKNAKPSKANTPTDGNVQLGASNVGESGNSKQESPVQESVSSSVDGGEVKGDASVGEINTTFVPKKETIKDDKGNPITFYHGSNNEFTDFDETMLGSFTGADSAKEGFFFTDNKGVANSYRQQAIYDAPNTEGLKEVLGGLSKDEIAKLGQEIIGNDAKYYYGDMSKQESIDDIIDDVVRDTENDSYYPDRNKYIEKISNYLKEKDIALNPYLDKGQTVETHLDIKNPKIVDAKEELAEDIGLAKIIKDAKNEGHDGVIIKNTYDSVSFDEKGNDTQLSTIVVVFDKKQINIKNKPVETPQPKSKEVAEVSDLDHAKSQIDKGVLFWDGNIANERVDLGISWADIRKGEADIKRGKENTVPAKRLIEAIAKAKKEGGYHYKQGTGGVNQRAKIFVSLDDVQRSTNEYKLSDAEQKEVDANEVKLAQDYENYFEGLDLEDNIDIYENYENQKGNDGLGEKPATSGESKNDVSNQEKPKPTTKEKIAERIKLSDAKVDSIRDAINGIDSIFGIKIKLDDVEGLNKNGIDIVNVIASIAKQAIAAGIHIDEAISKTIEHLKKTIDFDVNIDEIKERISPKKEADNDFKSKSGKKSLLGRLIDGGNPDVITKAVKELGENYDVRNQQEANDEAMAFIDKVGASEALKAIKDSLITNSDVKMLIYDEALTQLKTEISDEVDNNPEDREALIKKFQEVQDDFDNAVRDAGQGIAILNYIYNKNQTLKYNLKKQIADWKRNDPNNDIPADIKTKYEELDQKLKDLEEKTKEAEARAKKAEDELAIKNIQEDVERKSQAAKKNKSGLTPKELARKKELRNKFARANDVTGIPALLVDPEFREYLGLVFKTAKGDFANFSNEILKELGKSARQHLAEMFKEAGGKGDVKVTDLQSITISEEGKIKIPAQLLRDYVEQGYTDIDEIAALIKDDIADEFPDADVRDIRDALTGYGKQVNPNKDEINAEVNKLKEYGRLLSAYDDVMNGQMPLKSGLVRPKSEQKARELRRNINRLAKELNLEPVDLEKQWANAIDKVKSHLKNQIEDLDKQIANGEKRKIERTSIKLDLEAEGLKAERDAKKQILDDLVGKPELTEEQKIQKAENSLEKSIKKIEEEIATNDIAFKEKPTSATSAKIEQLKTVKKALLASKKQLRQEAGLIEQQRLKMTKTRIKNQIEGLKTRLQNQDFAKKVVTPVLADNELNTLRAEKEAIYEEYEKMKYLQELKNRTFAKKMTDAFLELGGLTRAIKASLDLGLVGIQLRGFTYSELWRNPKELGRKFVKLFGAIGSQEKTNKATALIIGHPLHSLAKKLDIGMTHPDLRNEVREEMASGSMLHFIWNLPMYLADNLGGQKFSQAKRTSIGDTFINSAKTQYNKLFQNYKLDIKQKEKFTVAEQWKNVNVFEAVERGLTVYGNQLRFEEFVRGVARLKAEGKDEINHLEDYKLLASYIRTFSGRAKPAGFELNQKGLNLFFFSFKNAASVFQQLNPVYYLKQHVGSTEFKNGSYFKPTVANKMAMATMFKSVVSTSATMLFIMAAYNASKDDDEEEMTIEKDPRSSDFGKLKLGTFRYDSWGGYIPLITLYARLLTEETKNSDGKVVQLGEDRNGIQNRGDAMVRFIVNKESPGFQMVHQYLASKIGEDKVTGEEVRQNAFGENLLESDAYSFYPIFMGAVKEAKEKDFEGVQAFLTAYSVLGLGNVQDYESKAAKTPEEIFLKSQEKKKTQFELPENEKQKIRVDDKLSRVESKIKMIDEIRIAQKMKLPYYISKDVALTKEEVADMDLESGSKEFEQAKKDIKAIKLKYNIKD